MFLFGSTTPVLEQSGQLDPNRGHRGTVVIANVLADRYASPEMVEVWSPEQKIVLERRLWVAVLEAQRDLGIAVPDEAIEAYSKVLEVEPDHPQSWVTPHPPLLRPGPPRPGPRTVWRWPLLHHPPA